MNSFFDDSTIRLLLLILFSAFILFFIVYGLFAIYHMFKFSLKGGLAIPSVIIFILVSAALASVTYLVLLNA